MNRFFTWIFSNEYYNEVISFAEKCKDHYKESFDVFFDSHYKKTKESTKTYLKNEFEGQKELYSHKEEIRVIQGVLDDFKYIRNAFRLGVNAFLNEKRLSYSAYSAKVQVVSNRVIVQNYDSIMNQFEHIKSEYGTYVDLYYNSHISSPSIEIAKDVINSLNDIKNFKRVYVKGERNRRNYPKTFEILKQKHCYNPSAKKQFYSAINSYTEGDFRVSEEYIDAVEYLKVLRWTCTLTAKHYYEEINSEQPFVNDFSDKAYDKKRQLINRIPIVKQMDSLVKRFPKSIICIYFGYDIKFTTFSILRQIWNDISVEERIEDIRLFNDYVNEIKADFPQAVPHFLKHPEVFYSDVTLGKHLFMSSRLVFKSWENYFNIKDKITPSAIELLCEGIMPKDDDFSDTAQCNRIILLQYFDPNTKHFCKKFIGPRKFCIISPKEEHIRTILNSEYYGKRVTFSEDYTFEDFYELAITCERNNTTFDKVRLYIENNIEAIKAWNVSTGNESAIYTNNYTDVATKNASLMQYIEQYNREKEQRESRERQRREEERRKREAKEAEERRRREAKEAEERRKREEGRRKEQEERDRIYQVTHTLKTNNIAIRNYLSANNVRYLYHFTDRRNIESIRRHGGLYSWNYCNTHNISIPYAGGNSTSRSLDCRYNLEDYVRLSFCDDHPMTFRLSQNGYDLVLLKIKVDVAELEATLFSDMNATDNNCRYGGTLDDLQRVDLNATRQHYLSSTDPLFKRHQAEVLVKTFIPIDKIVNIDFPQSI